MTRPLRQSFAAARLVPLIAMAVIVVVACGPRDFRVADGEPAVITVTLRDRTGLVESIGLVQFDMFEDVPGEVELSNTVADVVRVTWIGGRCPTETMFELVRDDERFVFGYDLGEGCFEQQAVRRGFEIRLSEPVAVDGIAVRPRPAAGL